MKINKILTADDSYIDLFRSAVQDIESFQDFLSRVFRVFRNENVRVRTLTFQVTDDCNLCCSYCYQINKGKRRMKIETAKKLIDYLLDSTPENNKYINYENTPAIIVDFIGGEPLLEIDLIDQIVDYFIEQTIIRNHPWREFYMINIGTNGVLYFDDRVQKFISKHDKKVSISITVDGNKRLHDACRIFHDGSGSYDLASSAAKDWMGRIQQYSTKLTIAPENVEYLYEAIISSIEFGYKAIHANCVFEEGWTIEHAKIYYHQMKLIADYMIDNKVYDKVFLKLFTADWYRPMDPVDNKNWCGGDGNMLSMDPDGYLYNCVRYMESSLGDSQKGLCIGHVDRGISITDQDKQNVHCMQCITRKSQSTDDCYTCPLADGCAWCSAYNYQCHGTPDKRTIFHCIMHQAESLATAYYWNRFAISKYEETGDIKYYYTRFPIYIPYDWAIDIIDDDEYQMLIKLARQDKRRY